LAQSKEERMKEFNTIRPAGRITLTVLFITLSVFIATVYADDNGPGDNPVKPGLMAPEASVKGGGSHGQTVL